MGEMHGTPVQVSQQKERQYIENGDPASVSMHCRALPQLAQYTHNVFTCFQIERKTIEGKGWSCTKGIGSILRCVYIIYINMDIAQLYLYQPDVG